MKEVLALIDISIPGRSLRHSKEIEDLVGYLEECRIPWRAVDSVLGWGNLNQDWIEFEAEIETSWGWCEVKFTEGERQKFIWGWLKENLESGKFLMHIMYKAIKASGEVEYVPHG